MIAAFDVVNTEFQRLFTHLFGGGTAELQLIESDDPLEAGLEILARPPGKKPQTTRMTTRWTDASTEVFEMYGPGPDGKETKMMEITYTRRK